MDKIYLVTAECGGYYCGCGVGHLVGVYSTPDKAAHAASMAERVKHKWGDRDKNEHRSYSDIEVRPVVIDVMPELLEVRKF